MWDLALIGPILFCAGLCLGWGIALIRGARAEQATMLCLISIWSASMVGRLYFGETAPLALYAGLAWAGGCIMIGLAKRHWQLIVAALFALHLGVTWQLGWHPLYVWIITWIGYAQIAIVIWASFERERGGAGMVRPSIQHLVRRWAMAPVAWHRKSVGKS